MIGHSETCEFNGRTYVYLSLAGYGVQLFSWDSSLTDGKNHRDAMKRFLESEGVRNVTLYGYRNAGRITWVMSGEPPTQTLEL